MSRMYIDRLQAIQGVTSDLSEENHLNAHHLVIMPSEPASVGSV